MNTDSSIRIEEARHVDSELMEAVQSLLRQLTLNAPQLTIEQLEEVVSSPSSTLLLARDVPSRRIVGTLTLVIFRIPSGVRARIEDVVVDKAQRRRGIGESLSLEAVRIAQARGARSIDLTSNAERPDANRLYQRIGFVRRETNVYRYDENATRVSRL